MLPSGEPGDCLRLLPGSHTPLQQEQLKPLIAWNHYKTYQPEYAERTFGVRGQDLPSVAIEAQLGDLVFFHHSMYHAVFNHQPDRRLLAYWFVGYPDTPQRLASLWRNDVTFTASWRRNGEKWRDPPGMATSVLLDHPNPQVRSLMEPAEVWERWRAEGEDAHRTLAFPDAEISMYQPGEEHRNRTGMQHYRDRKKGLAVVQEEQVEEEA